MSAEEVWNRNKNGKYELRRDKKIYGKVEKGYSSAIVKTNLKGQNQQFVDDFSSLPKNCKNKITDMFCNKKKKVVYLVNDEMKKK